MAVLVLLAGEGGLALWAYVTRSRPPVATTRPVEAPAADAAKPKPAVAELTAEQKKRIDQLLATAKANADDKEKAKTVLGVLDEIFKIDPDQREANALRRKVSALIVPATPAAWLEKGVAAARAVSSEGLRMDLLRELAEAMAQTGDSAGAQALAGEISNDSNRALALVAIAEAQIAKNDADAAKLVLKDAQAAALKIGDSRQKAAALAAVCRNLAASGETDAAKALVKSAPGGLEQSRCYSAIACALAMQRDLAGARATTDLIENEQWRAAACFEATECFARVGDIEHAEFMFQRGGAWSNDQSHRAEKGKALCALSKAQAQEKDFNKAKQTVESLSEVQWKGCAMANLAIEQAKAGAFEIAKGTADAVPDVSQRARALSELASLRATGDMPAAKEWFHDADVADATLPSDVLREEAYAMTLRGEGRSGAASALAATMTSIKTGAPKFDSMALTSRALSRDVAEAHASIGDLQAVEAWVNSMNEPAARAAACMGAAVGLAK